MQERGTGETVSRSVFSFEDDVNSTLFVLKIDISVASEVYRGNCGSYFLDVRKSTYLRWLKVIAEIIALSSLLYIGQWFISSLPPLISLTP